MSEEQIEWRYVWKECVDAGQKSLLLGDKKLERFFPILINLYGDDKMISFEKAITFECLGNKMEAEKLYKQSADESTGLPVEHWRKRAQYYLDRNSTKITNYEDYYCVQWDTFYNMHTYYFLHPHIRYLAISSVSRVNTEPEMAVVIFRTCLDICIELYWSISAENDYFLGEKINTVFNGKVDKKLKQDIDTLLDEGNLAAHPFKEKKIKKGESQKKKDQPSKFSRTKEKPFKYENKDISIILKAFDHVMSYCNLQAEKCGKSLLYKDLELV